MGKQKNNLMKNFILQTFDKKEMRKVSFKKWDIVIKMAESQNEYVRALYEGKSITRKELDENVIGFIVGENRTLCM